MHQLPEVYDRTHKLSSPEHAAAFASRINHPDVRVTIDGARVRIETIIHPGESYDRNLADENMEELATDTTPRNY